MTDTDQVFKEVANLLCEHMGVKLEKIRMDTSLLRDCGMAGDDADEFFQSLNEKYQIDWEGINLDLMFGSEGISIRFPWNIHKDRELIYKSQPCLVSDVVKAAIAAHHGKLGVRHEKRWKEDGKEKEVKQIYKDCLKELQKPVAQMKNVVKRIYDPYSPEIISKKISEIVRPNHIFSKVEVIYQSIEDLHLACPKNLGDWYFTGNYPTPGGNRVVLNAFKNFYEGKNVRAY